MKLPFISLTVGRGFLLSGETGKGTKRYAIVV